MAYNRISAQRIRSALPNVPGLQEKKMFGGFGFILNSNMACGVHGDGLIVRLVPPLSAVDNSRMLFWRSKRG